MVVGIWDQVGWFFLNVVSGNFLIFGIGALLVIGLILVLAQCSWSTISIFMIFPCYALLVSGIFGGIISKSAIFVLFIYAGYKYFKYMVKFTGHM